MGSFCILIFLCPALINAAANLSTSKSGFLLIVIGSTKKYCVILSAKTFLYQNAEEPLQLGMTLSLNAVFLTMLSLSVATLYRCNISVRVGEKAGNGLFCA